MAIHVSECINQGWRLPSKEQMLSLFWGEVMDFGSHFRVASTPSTDMREFFQCFIVHEDEQIWTATADEINTDFAWLFDLQKSKLFAGLKSEQRAFRLVRVATGLEHDLSRHELNTQNNKRFRLSADKTFVTDMATHLDWSRCVFDERADWDTCQQWTRYLDPLLQPCNGFEF